MSVQEKAKGLHKQKLLKGAADIQAKVTHEFASARLQIDEFRWNPGQDGGMLLNSPFQLFSVRIGDWESGAELVDSDIIVAYPEFVSAFAGVLEIKINRLLKAYTRHLLGRDVDTRYAG